MFLGLAAGHGVPVLTLWLQAWSAAVNFAPHKPAWERLTPAIIDHTWLKSHTHTIESRVVDRRVAVVLQGRACACIEWGISNRACDCD
jgi:hypothetical protein